MTELPRCYGIIPARYGSTRFPGKPLADILGKPMFWHVFKRASRCNEIHQVILATDDKRIVSAAKTLDVPVVMTRSDHASGTDRVLEAAEKLNVPENAVVVNIQGDEPAHEPAMLTELVLPFSDSKDGRALYFSRSPIPYHRDQQKGEFYGHIGLYAFRMNILRQFVAMGPSDLELTEKLEQLRLLESGIPIHVVKTEHRSFGVDRPSDIETVTQIIMGDR
ncbi:MAG: 3-deoxy-manno-octulosonate cytidylyltransferase [Deltaproteobacteria bacterium]|nr:3-deoxy-manno-octulosonate cytidylyltransferase [Deltaproteobacteria bacterium]